MAQTMMNGKQTKRKSTTTMNPVVGVTTKDQKQRMVKATLAHFVEQCRNDNIDLLLRLQQHLGEPYE